MFSPLMVEADTFAAPQSLGISVHFRSTTDGGEYLSFAAVAAASRICRDGVIIKNVEFQHTHPYIECICRLFHIFKFILRLECRFCIVCCDFCSFLESGI